MSGFAQRARDWTGRAEVPSATFEAMGQRGIAAGLPQEFRGHELTELRLIFVRGPGAPPHRTGPWMNGGCGLMPLRQREQRPAYSSETETPSVKFDVAWGLASRNQHWKFQLSPTAAATAPLGCGIAARSTERVIVPVEPELWI